MSLLSAVVARLERERIRHALIGAAALAVHGVSRSTAAIDLLTVDSRVLGGEFWAPVAAAGPPSACWWVTSTIRWREACG